MFIGNIGGETLSGIDKYAEYIYNNIPTNNKDTSFYCLSRGNGCRLVYGFFYADKSYGSFTVLNYDGLVFRFKVEKFKLTQIIGA